MNLKAFYFASIMIVLVWASLLIFFVVKTSEITKDPCQICAWSMGEEVTCTLRGIYPASRVYYPNWSMREHQYLVKQERFNLFNLTIEGMGEEEIEGILERNRIKQGEAHDEFISMINGS